MEGETVQGLKDLTVQVEHGDYLELIFPMAKYGVLHPARSVTQNSLSSKRGLNVAKRKIFFGSLIALGG